jgi:fructose/tagatose bisphosphate aldolase
MTQHLSRLVAAAHRQPREGFIVSESNLSDRPWLGALLAASRLELAIAGDIPLRNALVSLGDANVVLVLVDAGTATGVRLKDFVDEKIGLVRSAAPNAGIVLIADAQINPRILPPRTWRIRPDTRLAELQAMVRAVQEAREDRVELARRWPRVSCAAPAPRPARPRLTARGALPNFNVKHPSMLVPIAQAALAQGTPVFCEISPQEALVCYQNSGTARDSKARVKQVLRQVREDVDFVRANTGCDIRLHLDHCDDPDLIVHALEVGFDSIMADGSARSLRANIQFTGEAMRRASAFQVPVEGEVGAIDPAGRRKSSKTMVADVREFIAASGVDYLGINLGQVHGTDYAFNRSRRALRDFADLELQHGAQDELSLLRACMEVDGELDTAGFAICSPERRQIHGIRERLVAGDCAAPADLFGQAYAEAAVASGCWIAEVEHRWHRHRLDLQARKRELYRQVTGEESGKHDKPGSKRFIDFNLLAEIHAMLREEKARIVLHGGSSIAYNDLSLLGRYGVARINFGSNPFISFLNALATRRVGDPARIRFDGPSGILRFLTEDAADWRDWLARPPAFLHAFQQELQRQYFVPLLGAGSPAARRPQAAPAERPASPAPAPAQDGARFSLYSTTAPRRAAAVAHPVPMPELFSLDAHRAVPT